MNIKIVKKAFLFLFFIASSYNFSSLAQESVIIPPLFEYVVAPEDLPDLQSRTDYIMDNFWSPFDFKSSNTIDQNALNHAFEVYAQAMPYASENKVSSSVKRLIKNIKGNPILSLQFAKAAEEALYGPRANFWSDELYLAFVNNLLDNKKIPESKKKRFNQQKQILTSSSPGNVFPELKVVSLSGIPTELALNKEISLIGFVFPDTDDCRYPFLKLDISATINDMIDEGRLDVAVIFLSETNLKDIKLPEKWINGVSVDSASKLDLRITPGFYIVDKNGRIMAKDLTIDDAILYIEQI